MRGGQIVAYQKIHNLVTQSGVTYLQEVFLNGAPISSQLYMGLISNGGFLGLRYGESAISRSWNELAVTVPRPQWNADQRNDNDPILGSFTVRNTIPVTWNVTASFNGSRIIGVFIANDDDVYSEAGGSSNADPLFNGKLVSNIQIFTGDTISAEYNLTLRSSL